MATLIAKYNTNIHFFLNHYCTQAGCAKAPHQLVPSISISHPPHLFICVRNGRLTHIDPSVQGIFKEWRACVAAAAGALLVRSGNATCRLSSANFRGCATFLLIRLVRQRRLPPVVCQLPWLCHFSVDPIGQATPPAACRLPTSVVVPLFC